jgi:glycine/serine hydroxymethyltransferase
MGVAEMKEVASLIARALDARENPDGLRAIAADVERLASRFPLYAGRLVTSRA